MRFGTDLINLGWKDSCLGAADYSRMSKLLPTQPEWVMYYWCFVDMYRTKIFIWVTIWRAIFESIFFSLHMKARTPRNVSWPASEIRVPMVRPCCMQREPFLQVWPRARRSNSHGCVGSSYCQYNHISLTPTPNPPFFFYVWLELKFLVDKDLWLCGGQPIQRFGLTLVFMNFLNHCQSISHSGLVYEPAMYRFMQGDM